MTYLSEFLEERKRLHAEARKCPAAGLVDEVRSSDDAVADDLMRAIMDPATVVTVLHGGLRKAGYHIARESLSQHRAGTCVCLDGK